MRDADCYMFDEASSFLDIKQRMTATELIRSLAFDGAVQDGGVANKYILVVEHDLAVLDYMCARACAHARAHARAHAHACPHAHMPHAHVSVCGACTWGHGTHARSIACRGAAPRAAAQPAPPPPPQVGHGVLPLR